MTVEDLTQSPLKERGENKATRFGQHRGLCGVAGRVFEKHLVHFLDDVCVTILARAHNILGEEMWWHAKITFHFGKIVIWNRIDRAPEGVEVLEVTACVAPQQGEFLVENHKSVGGLGLRFVARFRGAAHWANWADSFVMVFDRHPDVF